MALTIGSSRFTAWQLGALKCTYLNSNISNLSRASIKPLHGVVVLTRSSRPNRDIRPGTLN